MSRAQKPIKRLPYPVPGNPSEDMSATSAVCINCGQFKSKALRACGSCGFMPSSPEDMARSLILSRQFDAGEDVVGLPPEELKAAARQIQAGTPYRFDPELLDRVTKLHEGARAVTPRRLIVDLARWLLPPVVLLAGVCWLIWHK